MTNRAALEELAARVEAEKIAKGLTEAQRCALSQVTTYWAAGPYLPEAVIREITFLRETGLVEREFGDEGKPETSATTDSVNLRVIACWWFRLTPLGLEVRRILETRNDGE